jgi:hypothetical protein
MPATIVELAVLALDSRQDAQVAIERLAAMGPVILLSGLRSADYAAVVSDASTRSLIESWPGDELDPAAASESHSGTTRRPDERAIARLETLRAEHGADWLIATDETLATARACKGLRVICLGPGAAQVEPTRPDHRAHSLLDAARFIEMTAAFA